MDFKEVAKKWQNKWEAAKLFYADVDDKKKYYITTPYPYMSGLLHLGHLFTYNAPEILSRYKRMQGYNVLFKYAFHCTGSPIVTAAKRVLDKEPTQLQTLKKMGITDFKPFEKPEHWVEHFSEPVCS